MPLLTFLDFLEKSSRLILIRILFYSENIVHYSRSYLVADKQPSVERVEESYPFIVTHKSGKIIPIVQAYAYSKYLGKLWVTFNDNGDVTLAEGDPQLLDSSIGKGTGHSSCNRKLPPSARQPNPTTRCDTPHRVRMLSVNYSAQQIEQVIAYHWKCPGKRT